MSPKILFLLLVSTTVLVSMEIREIEKLTTKHCTLGLLFFFFPCAVLFHSEGGGRGRRGGRIQGIGGQRSRRRRGLVQLRKEISHIKKREGMLGKLLSCPPSPPTHTAGGETGLEERRSGHQAWGGEGLERGKGRGGEGVERRQQLLRIK